MKKNNNKGFTLMEMLIVVAIIAILIAIAIPTFSGQLEKARQAADNANVRAAYSNAMSEYLSAGANAEKTASAGTMQEDYDGTTKFGEIATVAWSKGQSVTINISDSGTATLTAEGGSK